MTKDIAQNKDSAVIEENSEVASVASVGEDLPEVPAVKLTAKQRIHNSLDRIRSTFRGFFVADGIDNEAVRLRHLRVAYGMGLALFFILVACVYVSIFIDEGGSFSMPKSMNATKPPVVEINKLANGPSHERTWGEKTAKEVIDIKRQQEINKHRQTQIEEKLEKDSISRKELNEIVKNLKNDLSEEYDKKLESYKTNNVQAGNVGDVQSMNNPIESINNKSKIRTKKIGTYIPAGSYVEAKMISGVDAGIGITAESDPRQVLLRVTGKVISAGHGKNYLTTDKLMGCVVQCQATGDLSSEKAYLKPVIMTCAKDSESIIEVPVKGYVSANGKVGIRGEIVSREGDLVAKSFLSGLIGGLGSGVSQFYEPQQAISNGFAVKTGKDNAKGMLGSGLGKGINDSSNRLSDYLIKRAEQYQPVISINEGVAVDLVFQEGFSIKEGEDDAR